MPDVGVQGDGFAFVEPVQGDAVGELGANHREAAEFGVDDWVVSSFELVQPGFRASLLKGMGALGDGGAAIAETGGSEFLLLDLGDAVYGWEGVEAVV